jgi:RNA polymerase sigma-70 factor (ECF subfamily)
MLRAFRGLGKLENPQIFGPWLMRIVSNLALNFRHGRARRAMVSLDEQADRSGSDAEGNVLGQLLASDQQRPEQELMTAELADRIRQALAELPDRQRLALVLFSIEDRPQKEVAEIIGCSVEAVKWHVFTARKKLKEKLADLLAEP